MVRPACDPPEGVACGDRPGGDRPLGAIAELDSRLDSLAGSLRGRYGADLAAAALSALGDLGFLWLAIATTRAWSPARRPAALRALLFTGAAAPALNYALKRAVGRRRPSPALPARASDPLVSLPAPDDPPGPKRSIAILVRQPRNASFPSGHTLASWCAATLLADGDPLGPLYVALAAGVAWSRVHLRHHHPTDVIAGAALGTTLGLAGRWIWPLPGAESAWRARR